MLAALAAVLLARPPLGARDGFASGNPLIVDASLVSNSSSFDSALAFLSTDKKLSSPTRSLRQGAGADLVSGEGGANLGPLPHEFHRVALCDDPLYSAARGLIITSWNPNSSWGPASVELPFALSDQFGASLQYKYLEPFLPIQAPYDRPPAVESSLMPVGTQVNGSAAGNDSSPYGVYSSPQFC